MGGIFKGAALILLFALSGPASSADCDVETGANCRSKPFPLHKPDPAIKETPAVRQADRFAVARGKRISLQSAECAMEAALCHCTNAMIAAKAKSLGARVTAAYAFPGAALVKGSLGGAPFEIVISREAGCPIISQRRS